MTLNRRHDGNDFYPRPPRGGRRDLADAFPQIMEFLSTPSARRATSSRFFNTSIVPYFYPRPPRGGRPGVGSTKVTRV